MNFNKLIIINTSFIQNQTGIRVIRRLYFDISMISTYPEPYTYHRSTRTTIPLYSTI